MNSDSGTRVEEENHVVGDVIGDTAYSERFVLKILLKLSNKDSLKEDLNEESFEDDLCTLWNMTVEKDVVLFLLKHDVFEIINFVLPVLESARIIEIIIGIVANMCCQKEATRVLSEKKDFLKYLADNMKSDDSLILIQLLRLINSSLFFANEEHIIRWMDVFETTDYSVSLYFILKNSCHKSVLINALENLSFVSKFCNIEKTKESFFAQFVGLEAINSFTAAFMELVVTKKDECDRDELEKVYGFSLIIVNGMFSLDKSPEVYNAGQESALSIIKILIHHFEDKLIKYKDIDTDLVDIVDLTSAIIREMHLSEKSDMNFYFMPIYHMWKALYVATNLHKNGESDFEDSSEELAILSNQIKVPMCTLLCDYILKCSESNLLQALDTIYVDYNIIINEVSSEELRDNVSKRTLHYRDRLKKTGNS